jgi:hypothetical protein
LHADLRESEREASERRTSRRTKKEAQAQIPADVSNAARPEPVSVGLLRFRRIEVLGYEKDRSPEDG